MVSIHVKFDWHEVMVSFAYSLVIQSHILVSRYICGHILWMWIKPINSWLWVREILWDNPGGLDYTCGWQLLSIPESSACPSCSFSYRFQTHLASPCNHVSSFISGSPLIYSSYWFLFSHEFWLINMKLTKMLYTFLLIFNK